MARVALIAGAAVAGAALSVATGGLGTFAVGAWLPDIIAGATMGASVGEMAASFIFHPNLYGPHLTDQQVSNSANGSPIPFGYGGFRIAAQIIWSSGITETQTATAQSAKGMPGNTQITYTYTISFAAAFCEGPAQILRIWGDSKLIYDTTGKGAVTSDQLDTGITNSHGVMNTEVILPTIYPGNESQQPDPTIQASEGVDSTPAFRNICYLVYENFPLADFGNRLPNIRAEICMAQVEAYIKDVFPPTNIGATAPGENNEINPPAYCYVDTVRRAAVIIDAEGCTAEAIDLATTNTDTPDPWETNTAYTLGEQMIDPNGNVETCIQAGTTGSTATFGTEIGDITLDGGVKWFNTGAGPLAIPITASGLLNFIAKPGESYGEVTNLPLAAGIDTRNFFWMGLEIDGTGASTTHFLVQFDPTTLTYVVRVNLPAPVLALAFAQVAGKDLIYATTSTSFSGGGMLYVIESEGGSIITSAPWAAFGTSSDGAAYPAVDPSTGTAYVVQTESGSYDFHIVALQPLSWELQSTTYDFTGDSAHGFSMSCMYDPIDNSILVFTDAGAIYKIDAATMTITTNTAAGVIGTGNSYPSNLPKWYGGLVPTTGIFYSPDNSTPSPGNLIGINHATLAIASTTAQQTWFSLTWPGIADAAFDAATQALVVSPSGSSSYSGFTYRLYLNRQSVEGETLDEVVADICTRSGMASSQFDVTALASTTLDGYYIGRNTDGKSILTPLTQAFFFDAMESDFKLVFVPRGGAAAMSIPEADLGLESDEYELEATIAQEHDLPKNVEVVYNDPELDYQQGKQQKQRPARIVKTLNQTMLELPITLDGDTALQIADSTLRMIWDERNSYTFRLWRGTYLALDPTDVFTFTYEGIPFVARLVKASMGQDYSLQISAVSEDPKNYVSVLEAPPVLFTPDVINPAAPTVFYVLDIPLLEDSDAAPAGSTGYYYALASPSSGWPGGVLYDSVDDENFTQEGYSSAAIVYGIVSAATPAPPISPFIWDTMTQIVVRLPSSQALSSTTQANVLTGGANTFILGDEVMAFQNATQNSDGSWTLSNLLRGLRGTEWACGTHVTAETALFLPVGLHRNNVASSLIGVERYFEAITIGQSLTSAGNPEPVTLEGNDLKPYAPCQITGSRDGSNNLTIDWVRRTRLGGDADWLDGVADVPLSEVFELYDVDVMNGSAVARTFSSLTSPTATYSAAEQTSDGFTPGNPITVNVYQRSAVVGRGFGANATV